MGAWPGLCPNCAACWDLRNERRPAFAGTAPVVRHAKPLVSEVRKVKTPATPEEVTSAAEPSNDKPAAFFCVTDNLRHLPVIQALTVRPIPREELDRIAGCSNGPELVAELRRPDLDMPCTRTKKIDRDMFECFPGVYHFTEADRRKLLAWKRKRTAGGASA